MIKSLDFWQLKSYAQHLNDKLFGAQLQSIWTSDQALILQFYKSKNIFLNISLAPQNPLLCSDSQMLPVKKKTTPVALFLNSNAKNLRCSEISVQEDKGRLLNVILTPLVEGAERRCSIEIYLIPKLVNVSVVIEESSQKKQVWWNKPKELGMAQPPVEYVVNESWGQWEAEVFAQLSGGQKKSLKDSAPADSSVDPKASLIDEHRAKLEKAINKKRNALQSLQDKLDDGEEGRWRDLGLRLQSFQELSIEQQKLVDSSQSPMENMQMAFAKAKEIERKKTGVEQRMQVLQQEIEQSEKQLADLAEGKHKVLSKQLDRSQSDKQSKGLMEKAKVSGRRIRVDEQYEAVIGKSAKDNLALLRNANKWDLWLHLKDYPGSHAIIHCPKDRHPSDVVIKKVAQWLAKESLKPSQLGVVYDVVLAEVRHVRPIKGDKLGRVTYHHPKVVRVQT